MRTQTQITAPLIVACSALLLCIGVIAGLTAAVIMQNSNSARPAPVPPPAALSPAGAGGMAIRTPPMANTPVAAANLPITTPLAAVPEVAAAILAQQQQDAALAANPPVPPTPSPDSLPLPAPAVPPMPTAEAPQPPAAPTQEPAPVVGDVTSAAEAQGDEVDPTTFQDDLQPMGQWVATSDYGACWIPQGVPVGWRPYTAGRWVYTECGWTWVSEEPWGHITYHYGSWVDHPRYGWIWVPGRVWAPAWVAWRVGGGYVGWAPLPPAACRRDIPVANAVVLRIPTPYFCFVGERDFCDDHVGRRMRPVQQNVTIIVQTRNSTNIDFSRTAVVNRSLSVDQVQQMTGRRPPLVHLESSDNNRDAEQRREHGDPVAYHPRPRPTPPAPVTSAGGDSRKPTSGAPSSPTPWPTPRPPINISPQPVVRPGDPTPPKPVVQPTPKPPTGGSSPWAPLPTRQEVSAPNQPKPPLASPAAPEPRPTNPQPTPKPTRDRGNNDATPADKPTAPPAARPADPPKRQADSEPTPAPEKRRERAPEPTSPPPAARPADPAPSRPEPPARPTPSAAPQRQQPAPADNQTITPGQTPDSSGGAGNARRGGR